MAILDRWILEYKYLEDRIAFLKTRRDDLNKLIKQEMMTQEITEYSTGTNNALLQIKRHKLNYDQGAMEQLLLDKGLWERARREVPDEAIVKQMYIDGDLTDDDLRSILAIPKDPNVALKVEPCTKE